jgi:hypothetical protein
MTQTAGKSTQIYEILFHNMHNHPNAPEAKVRISDTVRISVIFITFLPRTYYDMLLNFPNLTVQKQVIR